MGADKIYDLLRKQGLTNADVGDPTESLSDKPIFDFYCTSKSCCRYQTGEHSKLNRKTGKFEITQNYQYKERILKLRSRETVRTCPDCDNLLFSSKSNSKGRRVSSVSRVKRKKKNDSLQKRKTED